MASRMKAFLTGLYFGRSPGAVPFRYGLLGLDLLAILSFILASLVRHASLPAEYSGYLLDFERSIGLLLLLDLGLRLWISGNKLRFLKRFSTLIDGMIVVTLLTPGIVNMGFLRIFRSVDMLRSVHAHGHIHYSYKESSTTDVIFARSLHLVAFVIVMAEVVYGAQVDVNEHINSYTDALYFTLMTLTTTGFGDITLVGEGGRWLTIGLMVLGVSLFLRLIKAVWTTPRLSIKCPKCGFDRHELEASYCSRCGASVKSRD